MKAEQNEQKFHKEAEVGRQGAAGFISGVPDLLHVFSESYGRTEVHTEYRYNLVLFQEIRRFLRHRDILGLPAVLINIVGNVVVFIPYGLGLPLLFERLQSFFRVVILSFGTSLLAETMQLILRVGCFDVDDLLLNTVGGCIGYFVYLLFRRYWRGKYGKKEL